MTEKRHDMKKIIYRLFWLLPGLVFYTLFRLSEHFPAFTEHVYSRAIYRVIGPALSTITGILPFSLGELLLYAFILFVIAFIVVMIVHAVRAHASWWYVLLRRVITLLCVFSMVYAAFVFLWGFNYSRQKLADTLNLNASPATVAELSATCAALVDRANTLRSLIPEDEDGLFAPEMSRRDIMRNVPGYYSTAAQESGCSFLGGSFGRVKPVLWSKGLSQAHITGVYFPFTGEANVNADVPDLLFTATCLHEAAHQRGYAREDEANFLSYYVSSYSNDASVSYSGTMLALIHAMNKLYEADSDKYYELRQTYCDGIERDLNQNSAYWQQFESPVSDVAETVNNTYLKANGQQDGVKSYGRMVDLLIALWRSGGL
jgi:hypothetical protein